MGVASCVASACRFRRVRPSAGSFVGVGVSSPELLLALVISARFFNRFDLMSEIVEVVDVDVELTVDGTMVLLRASVLLRGGKRATCCC